MWSRTSKYIARINGREFSTFQAGDVVIARDCSRGGKTTLLGPLTPGQIYGSRIGTLHHTDIIGHQPRTRVSTKTNQGSGGQFMIHHPTLEEYVLLCSRQCTPIYPKDASAILSMLDISHGDRVLEAGTGNAGLTMHLARAVGRGGKVVSVETNKERAVHAKKIVTQFRRGQLLEQVEFHLGALAESVDGIAEGQELFDGVVLDMPMPWTQLPQVVGYLKTDRYVVCYLPNMSQVIDLVRACQPWPLLVEDVVEVDWRKWDVRVATIRNPTDESDEAIVSRPTHTPGGHTAFLVKLRRLSIN
ncbi:hypothetical protein GGI20_002141 [Coemansia sp. BCRC 34301]|nr:hypothetical protein GGI20_002141 [Coemansia sp. BCRC 34301]